MVPGSIGLVWEYASISMAGVAFGSLGLEGCTVFIQSHGFGCKDQDGVSVSAGVPT